MCFVGLICAVGGRLMRVLCTEARMPKAKAFREKLAKVSCRYPAPDNLRFCLLRPLFS